MWFRKGSPEEDEVYADAADVIGDSLADADKVRLIELQTGKNLREQLTIEEVQAIAEEGELRRFGWSRN